MMWSDRNLAVALSVVAAFAAHPAHAMPAPAPLMFVSATPADSAVVTAGTINVKLDAACTVNTSTLAVSINGTTVPQSSFLPFSACSSGRMQSQLATVNVTVPNSTITGGPTALNAGGSGN